jgi:beta-lactamase regulating signal transducer with metallopeptidase domain
MTAMGWMHPNLIHIGLLQGAEGVSRVAANSVVSGLWQGVALAAGAALCLRLVPRTTAAIRFAVWTAVFAVLALLPLFHAYFAGRTAEAVAGRGAVVHVDARWSVAIALLWLTVSLIRGVSLAAGAVRLRAIWKRAVPMDTVAGTGVLFQSGLRGAQLCTSADVDRPSVIGFFSPRILIPEELFHRLSPTELEQIVLHEAGHLRRADDWINLLQKLSLVLVPLNPVLLWIERRLCFERELACDDDVLLRTKAPKAYATCLTNLAEHRLGRRAAALALGAWEKQSELGRRVHRILRRGEAMGRMQARVVVGTLAVVLLGGVTELSRCPQLVSFSGQPAPMAADAQSLPAAAYQPVVFHPASHALRNGMGPAHETLLKMSMPSPEDRALKAAVQVAPKRKHSAAAPALLRTRQGRSVAQQQGRRWVVLTSWNAGEGEMEQSNVIFTVSGERAGKQPGSQSGERVFSSSYAAVPTEGGWLVIQL